MVVEAKLSLVWFFQSCTKSAAAMSLNTLSLLVFSFQTPNERDYKPLTVT